MKEEIERLMRVYAIGELEAFLMYCDGREIDKQTICAMVPTGKITNGGDVYFEGDKIWIRYNEWRQIKFTINLN